jgi:hypothetical protein
MAITTMAVINVQVTIQVPFTKTATLVATAIKVVL